MSNPAPLPLSPGRQAWRRFKKNRPAVGSAWYLGLLILALSLWPLLLHVIGGHFGHDHDPNQLSDAQFAPPDAWHWFGTDVHGRDLFSRVLYGAQISLLVGLVGTLVSLVIGVIWGAVAGYVGGRVDSFLMRVVDILYSLPSIIFVIVLITTLGELLKQLPWVVKSPAMSAALRVVLLFVGLGAVSWLTMARIVRGQVLALKAQQFVAAAQALGQSHFKILARHLLPNLLGIVVVYLTLTVPAVILDESFLSFLGLGIQPPQASWGSLLANGAEVINPIRSNWWLLVFPAMAMCVTLLALNFLGDAIREAADPRARQ